VEERSFPWISRYRRLNTIFKWIKEHLVAFIKIASVSILARRLKRLAASEIMPDVYEQPLRRPHPQASLIFR
jgi:hypothetical protein